jgi:hypothetical protein
MFSLIMNPFTVLSGTPAVRLRINGRMEQIGKAKEIIIKKSGPFLDPREALLAKTTLGCGFLKVIHCMMINSMEPEWGFQLIVYVKKAVTA